MYNKVLIFIGVFISLIATLFYFNLSSSNSKMELLVAFVAITSGITSILMSILSIRTAQFEVIKEYYLNGDIAEMVQCRQDI